MEYAYVSERAALSFRLCASEVSCAGDTAHSGPCGTDACPDSWSEPTCLQGGAGRVADPPCEGASGSSRPKGGRRHRPYRRGVRTQGDKSRQVLGMAPASGSNGPSLTGFCCCTATTSHGDEAAGGVSRDCCRPKATTPTRRMHESPAGISEDAVWPSDANRTLSCFWGI